MPNLKSLRQRIRSVGNTKQITKAMKMVAAAKLRRSQDRVIAARPYSTGMGRMIETLASQMAGNDGAPEMLKGRDSGNRVRLVVFTADRGLCGSFNTGIIRDIRARVPALQQQGKDVTLTCVGRKGHDVLKRQFQSIIKDVHTDMAKDLHFEKAETSIATPLVKEFIERNTFDECYAVYNTFKSAMSQELTWKKLIPVEVDESSAAENEAPMGDYIYEPSMEELLDALLIKNVTVQIYQALLESDASEHGARMTAMDNAVRNAGDMINKLTITFNRTRQAAITTELMEIIGGAESLKG
jgi:F-type H+-transporting ATPase subunit gamma